MKKYTFLFAAVGALLLVAACNKEADSALQKHNKFLVNLDVAYPSFEDESGTKVSITEGSDVISWTGDETATVVVGKLENVTNTKSGLQLELPSTRAGHFEGEIDLGSYTDDDIRAIVVPHSAGAYFRCKSTGENRIYMPIPSEQVQAQDGVLNPTYFPLFAKLSANDLEDGQLTLNAAGNLLRFNIYGKHPAMLDNEVFQSIKVTASGVITGTSEWKIGNSTFNSNGNSYVNVSLTEEKTIADKTADTGIKVFAGAIAGGARTLNKIEITTNVTTYTKIISKSIPQKRVSDAPKVFPINLNLANDGWTRGSLAPLQYSTDGGTTWAESLPEGSSFTSLAVKSPGGAIDITADDLTAIKNWMDNQSSPVSLDLSAAPYVATTFPATFQGSLKISHISFPSNVINVAASGFENCTNLKSVNLDGLTSLSNSDAFTGTGLETLVVPASITGVMQRSFQNCYDLREITYGAAWLGNSDSNYRMFQFGKGTGNALVTDVSKTQNLVVTITPTAKVLPGAAFSSNLNLVKVIFEGDELTIHNRAFQYCTNLAIFEMKGAAPPTISTKNILNLGENASNKKIIIPKGATETFTAHPNWSGWQAIINKGYTVEEAAE